ncbi:integrase arm-type DNA-binding domain-containing protein [Ferrovibrio sp.]|uniref:integrase arm-type DNA-binding domain-containing protein n=1 Tax=Ferrovibrio sp. TaxID=1917215 RepID=UPI0035B2308F
MEIKLTKTAIDALRPAPYKAGGKGNYVIYQIAGIKGAGVKVTDTGVKTFILNYTNRAGIKRRLTIGQYGALTVDDARAAINTLSAKITLGEDPMEVRNEARQAGIVSDLMDEYEARHIQGLDPGTRRTATNAIRRVKKLLGGRAVVELTPQHINVALDKLKDQPGAHNTTLAYLRAGWKWGVKMGVVPHTLPNPAEGIETLGTGSRKRAVTADEYRRILAAVEAEWIEAERLGNWNRQSKLLVLLFCLRTGARPSEPIKMKLTDLKPHLGYIELADHKTVRKTYKPKTFDLVPAVAAILERAALLRERAGVEDGYIFPRKKSACFASGNYKNWYIGGLALVLRRAGVKDFTMYNFRSGLISFASNEGGMTDSAIASVTRHMDPKTVRRHYLVPDDAKASTELDRLHQLQSGTDKPDPAAEIAALKARLAELEAGSNVVPLRKAS